MTKTAIITQAAPTTSTTRATVTTTGSLDAIRGTLQAAAELLGLGHFLFRLGVDPSGDDTDADGNPLEDQIVVAVAAAVAEAINLSLEAQETASATGLESLGVDVRVASTIETDGLTEDHAATLDRMIEWAREEGTAYPNEEMAAYDERAADWLDAAGEIIRQNARG